MKDNIAHIVIWVVCAALVVGAEMLMYSIFGGKGHAECENICADGHSYCYNPHCN